MHYLAVGDDFPPVGLADEGGILAISEQITIPQLIAAYQKGIFPWYNEGEPIIWWYPNPRCVLFPEKLKISSSMKKVLRKNTFQFKMDTSFTAVIISFHFLSSSPSSVSTSTFTIILYSSLITVALF